MEKDELESLEAGDELMVRGESFEVSHVDGGTVVLTPRNENGHGQFDLRKLKSGRVLFTRKQGIDPGEIIRRNA